MRRDNKGYYRNSNGKYDVRILENGTRKFLGSYDTEYEALDIYNKAREEKLMRSVESYGHRLADGVLYEDYYVVFDNGDIFSITGHKIQPHLNIHGYLHCHINERDETIHRIVAKCFISNPMNKPCINHINGIKTDNRVENLEWCTYSENNYHISDTGLRSSGKREPKLTEDDIRFIRNNYIPNNREYSIRALSEKFGVRMSTICNIIHYKTWKYVD